ncbi:MAG TPA: ABC transporter ATP-binding protein, partial [Dehalococcoidia bacterium]
AAVVGQALTVTAAWLSETVAWTATNELRARLFEHCLRLDMGFHKSRTPGEMIQRIDGDVDALSNFFSQLVIQVLGNLLLMGGVIALLLLQDWRVGLALGSFLTASLVAMSKVRSYAVPHWAAEREAGAQFYGFLGEQLAATEDIRANGARDYVMYRFHKQNQAWLRPRVRAFAANSMMWLTSLGAFAAADALAFALGAWLFHRGEMSIGGVYVLFYYTELLRRPIEAIRAQLQELQTASAAIGRVEELLAIEPALRDGDGAPIPDGPLALEFDGVSFRYEADEPVLEDVSFRLEPNRVLGLLGRTGSGKTTVARLVFRLYDPDAGEVRLGGVPVRGAVLDQLRGRVGMVTQDVQIFDASVRDNLTFFDERVPDERLLAVIEDIGLGRWLAGQPRGLDTRIAAGGLSAGEAQLLAFARLFLSDPGLVILDEASSRLDPATENLIERAVTKLLAGRTAILIAHRLATVQRADEVLILEDGRVLEAGPRAALAADPESRFARLLATDVQAVLA